MPNDDHHSGQHQDASKKPKEGNKPSEKRHDEKNRDYTTKMWQKIEGAVTKDKIGGIKKEVEYKEHSHSQSNPEMQQHKRHRRRRNRGKHHDSQGQFNAKENIRKPQVNMSEPVQFDEDRDEDVPHVQPTPAVQPVPPAPAAPVEPINPFAFPTPAYESKEKSKKEDKVNKELAEEKEHAFVSKIKVDSQVIPINPFEIPDPAKPLDERAFDEKPLENIGKVAEPEAVYYEEPASAEERGEVGETKRVNLSNEHRNEKGAQFEPARKEIIDVPADDVKEKKIEPVFPENIDKEDAQNGEFKDDFWNVLQQAGISKKKFFVILGVVVAVLIVGLFLVFGGYKIFVGGSDQKEVSDVEKVEIVNESDTEIPENLSGGEEPYDIISSYIFGLEFAPQVTPIKAEPISSFGDFAGVDAGLIFGRIDDLKVGQFVQYVKLLEEMNNIYNLDIYSMLNLAVDRRASLDNYLKETDGLISDGMTVLAAIEADLERIDIQYDDIIEQANQYETAFFNYLQNYYGQTAYDTLQYFVDSSNAAAEIKARYSAENTLRTMFINSLNLLRPRYRDVVANAEALIKGIRVFDVPKSNIDAIIPLQ